MPLLSLVEVDGLEPPFPPVPEVMLVDVLPLSVDAGAGAELPHASQVPGNNMVVRANGNQYLRMVPCYQQCQAFGIVAGQMGRFMCVVGACCRFCTAMRE